MDSFINFVLNDRELANIDRLDNWLDKFDSGHNKNTETIQVIIDYSKQLNTVNVIEDMFKTRYNGLVSLYRKSNTSTVKCDILEINNPNITIPKDVIVNINLNDDRFLYNKSQCDWSVLTKSKWYFNVCDINSRNIDSYRSLVSLYGKTYTDKIEFPKCNRESNCYTDSIWINSDGDVFQCKKMNINIGSIGDSKQYKNRDIIKINTVPRSFCLSCNQFKTCKFHYNCISYCIRVC